MPITRWDPFRDLMEFNERLNRLRGMRSPEMGESGELTAGEWMPACDVLETGDAIVVRAEMPGIKENDIDIRLEGNTLAIRGHREFQKEDEQRNYHRIERSYGSFARSFTLPSGVDAEKISANYENGVLEITVPKREETKPRQIKIGTGARAAGKSIDAESRSPGMQEKKEREKPRP